MNKKINIFISTIASIFMSGIYLPVKISGGFSSITQHNSRINIFSLLFKNLNKQTCYDCFNYEIRWLFLIIQLIIIFIISLTILNLFDKRRKNNG